MVMSQGTYTFLACFAGFWLVWALIVMLCCFCSFLQRRLKRRGQERLREQCLRALEMEPLDGGGGGVARGYPPTALPGVREALQFCPPQTLLPPSVPLHVPPHTLPQGNWTGMPEPDIFGKPPCYEEAVLMEDPPPPYSEVLSDHRVGGGGITCTKPPPTRAPPPRDLQELHQVETTGKPPPATVLPERAYSSLIRLPTARRWDSLGRLLSTMDLNHNTLGPPSDALQGGAPGVGTMPRQGRRSHPELGVGAFRGLGGGLEQDGGGGGLPTAFPLLGRSTAV